MIIGVPGAKGMHRWLMTQRNLFFLVIYLFSEYHLHQTFNQMSGHVCVAGDRATVNKQMPSQC